MILDNYIQPYFNLKKDLCMIGFVDVKVDMIKEAYEYLKNDDEIAGSAISTDKSFSSKIKNITDILNNSKGKSSYFNRADKIKLKRLLEEVAYASFATENDSMFIRIEMASIILDILKIYKQESLLKSSETKQLNKNKR